MHLKALLITALIVGTGSQLFAVQSMADDPQKVNQQEWAFLSLINAYRTSSTQCWNGSRWTAWPAGDRALSLSTSLTEAAEQYSQFLANANGCFGHNCDGRSPVQRTQAEQYPSSFIGENIYAGSQPAQEAFNRWRDSDGHNENMLHCAYKAIGIGQAYNPNSIYKWYWTSDFGDKEHQTKSTCDDCTPPSVQITSPLDGSSVQQGTKVHVSANASDSQGILFVEFYINGNLERVASSPFGFEWDTGNYSGPVTLMAKAYDNEENTAIHAITVNVR